MQVFLAGCKKLLIICGPSYFNRLWVRLFLSCLAELIHLSSRTYLSRSQCVMEVFVYIETGSLIENIELHFLPPPSAFGIQADETRAVIEFYLACSAHFKVTATECYNKVQKDRLLAIIEAASGTLRKFDETLKGILKELRGRALTPAVRRPNTLAAAPPKTPSPASPGDAVEYARTLTLNALSSPMAASVKMKALVREMSTKISFLDRDTADEKNGTVVMPQQDVSGNISRRSTIAAPSLRSVPVVEQFPRRTKASTDNGEVKEDLEQGAPPPTRVVPAKMTRQRSRSSNDMNDIEAARQSFKSSQSAQRSSFAT